MAKQGKLKNRQQCVQQADTIFDLLKSKNDSPKSELCFNNLFECFVAVLLSPQCTDKLVNKVTLNFFKKFDSFSSLANANIEEVKEIIKQVNYFNNKSKFLVESAKMIVDDFGGELPRTIEQLVRLPGVGRKVAQVILVECFGEPAVPVDTHVFRTVNRVFGENFKTPLQTEIFIKQNFKAECMADLHKLLVLHGRYVCTAKNPKCDECVLKKECQLCL